MSTEQARARISALQRLAADPRTNSHERALAAERAIQLAAKYDSPWG